MKRRPDAGRTTIRALTLGTALALAAWGCSHHDTSMMGPARGAAAVTPANGSTGVRLDAAVTVDFGTPVDRALVERGVHLIAEPDMDRPCPDTSMGGHGTMDSVMHDPALMMHMDEFHATHGRFSWNRAGSTCTFRPDSLLQPQTRYMVHLTGEMMSGTHMAGSAMMGGTMNSAGDMMLHFQTRADGAPAGS